MDRRSFELLKKLNNITNPTLFDCELKECQENYNYLLEVGYLEHKMGFVRVTRSGKEAIEKYEVAQKLNSLQEQNTEIQLSLKRVQVVLMVLTIIQVFLAVLTFFNRNNIIR